MSRNNMFEDSFLEEIRSNEELSMIESEVTPVESVSSEIVPISDTTSATEEDEMDDDLFSYIITYHTK